VNQTHLLFVCNFFMLVNRFSLTVTIVNQLIQLFDLIECLPDHVTDVHS
jgi:hypothetical protein